MDALFALTSSSAGQALLGAAITQAFSVVAGNDPLQAQADFASAVAVYQVAVDEWNKAKAANPAQS